MTIRGWLLSHLCAALFGFLLAVFLFSGGPHEKQQESSRESMELEIQQLKARLLTYQELKQRLDERIAHLLLRPSVEISPTVEIAPPPSPPDPAPTLIEQIPEAIPVAFDDAVALANFQGMADEVFRLIRGGEFESALATIRYLQWLLETDGDLNPLSEMRPLVQQASDQWSAYLMAALMTEPDMMVRFSLDLRNRAGKGEDIGAMAQLLTGGEVVQLALSGAVPVAPSTARSWLEALSQKRKAGRRLANSEIATLGQIPGPGPVNLLAEIWEFEKNRDPVIGALVQHDSPESRRLLQRLIFEISDRDLREALELWLKR